MSEWIPELIASVGAATGIGSLVVAVFARNDAGRADRRAGEAERTADDARAGADSLEVSLQGIGQALSEMNERDARSWGGLGQFSDLSAPGHDGAPPPSAPLPAFNLEYVRGHAYRLRNTGASTATDVTVSPEGLPVVANRLPRGVTIEPFRSTDQFLLQGAMGAPLPGEIAVTCAELSGPVVLPIPSP